MKRRDFLILTGLGMMTPPLARAECLKPLVPTTVDELYSAISSLGDSGYPISKKHHETIIPLSGRPNFKQCGPEETYTHSTYMVGSRTIDSTTEAKLVGHMWEQMQAVFSYHKKKPTIFWRRLPDFYMGTSEDGSQGAYLSFRISIGCDKERPAFRPFSEKSEGAACPVWI